MKNLTRPPALLILGLALGAGCGGDAYAPKKAIKYDVENREKLVLLDARVQRSVICSGIQERTLADGRLEIAANLRNREGRPIEVQIGCVFKAAKGFPTGDESPFQTVLLAGNAQESVQFSSRNNLAKKYTLRIRETH